MAAHKTATGRGVSDTSIANKAGRDVNGQVQQADAAMENTRYAVKEEQEYGRAREESRGDFQRRWGRGAGSGFTIIERGPYTCAYRGVARVQEPAAGVRQSLQSWGIDSVVDGPVYVNKDGVTTARSVREAATLQGMVFVSSHTTIPPQNTAGHEAYHAWKGTGARLDYTDMIRENLNYGSKEFLHISGHLNSGDYEPVLRAMFRDYNAVKAAWETLVRENGIADNSLDIMKERQDNAQREVRRNEPDHDTEKRGVAVRGLQETYSAHADL